MHYSAKIHKCSLNHSCWQRIFKKINVFSARFKTNKNVAMSGVDFKKLWKGLNLISTRDSNIAV